MKNAKLVSSVFVSLWLFVVPLAWGETGSVEQQIKAVTDQIVAAQLKGDAAAYGNLLADDYPAVRGAS